MVTKKEELQVNKGNSSKDVSERKVPTSGEVVCSIRKNFSDNIKPLLDEWNKDVTIIRYK